MLKAMEFEKYTSRMLTAYFHMYISRMRDGNYKFDTN